MTDWDATAYERISAPQFEWGKRVLARLDLRGDERVIDAGCGAGRLTELLAERLPRGHVIALDRSESMIARSRERLARFGERVSFVTADLATHVERPAADAVFSTATLHWVLDHDTLFASLAASLRTSGRLVAQCGGAGNIARLCARTERLRASAEFAPFFAGWRETWHFATAEETLSRLARSGFVEARASLAPKPARFDDEPAFREFVSKVVLRDELARIDDAAARVHYLDAVVRDAARDDPRFTLDYVRLDIDARRG